MLIKLIILFHLIKAVSLCVLVFSYYSIDMHFLGVDSRISGCIALWEWSAH